MIVSDYESRLIDRIAAKELIAARLNPRQKRVVCRYFLHDETLQEVGDREGVGKERIRQILDRSLRLLREAAERALPPSFDKTEFLRHQHRLIARRQAEAAWRLERDRADAAAAAAAAAAFEATLFERERDVLDGLLKRELEPEPKPKPKPAPPPKPAWKSSSGQTVEPWFDLALMPIPDGMREIATYATGLLVAIRRPSLDGLARLGWKAVRIECDRNADAIAHAINRLARELPAEARLSAKQEAVPAGMLGASVTGRYVAMRVVSI